jgi:hypothetical protein
MCSGRSWRAGPVGDVPWCICYQRYALWCRRGTWDAIRRILYPDADPLFDP